MAELDLVRDLYPERSGDPHARRRVRAAVAAGTYERRRSGWRLRRIVPAFGAFALASMVVTAVVLVLGGPGATVSASAARVLHQAARAARRERSVATLLPGQYLYTKSVDAYLATTAGTRPDGTTWSYSALVPNTREIWLAADETGWLHETAGEPVWLSERDRQAWIAGGSPDLGSGTSDTRLVPAAGTTTQMPSLDLPSNSDALYVRLYDQAKGNGNGTYPEMFTLIGDALRESYTTPAQRSALFEVAARLPGIELVGKVTDSAGRPAVAVAMDYGRNRMRSTLLFDPASYALLGEEDRVLAGNSFDYPAGTVIGRATYLEQQVVDSVPAAVVDAAKH